MNSFFGRISAASRLLPRPRVQTIANAEQKDVDAALRALDLISRKRRAGAVNGGGSSHSRLVQSCMEEMLKMEQRKARTRRDNLQCAIQKKRKTEFDSSELNLLRDDDPLSLLLQWRSKGLSPDATVLSGALSMCGVAGDLTVGRQLHCLSIKVCENMTSAVASSLISLYSKCSELSAAHQVFEDTPLRGTVLYTAVIAAHAQHSMMEHCLHLFAQMRTSEVDPNDYTYSSVLRACTDAGCLKFGRALHSLELRAGFDSHVHVRNALISMYAKCGSIDEAASIFKCMPFKDLISWNALISGYAQCGLARRALSLVDEMTQQFISPDAITFIGALSACRHAGLVEDGRHLFSTMLERGIIPNLDHYACIVDLFARGGRIKEALGVIEEMPMRPNAVIWGSLLSSCKVHGDIEMGVRAAWSRIMLEPQCASAHVQLANLCASVGWWDGFAQIRKLMKDRGLKTNPGCSWIEIGGEVYSFKPEGRSTSLVNKEVAVLNCLDDHMKSWRPIILPENLHV